MRTINTIMLKGTGIPRMESNRLLMSSLPFVRRTVIREAVSRYDVAACLSIEAVFHSDFKKWRVVHRAGCYVTSTAIANSHGQRKTKRPEKLMPILVPLTFRT
jgi:hypothetical protein